MIRCVFLFFVLLLLLFVLFLFFLFSVVVFFCLFFKYCYFFVCVLVFYLFIYSFIYFLFASFLICLCVSYVIACFFSYSFIFVVPASGRDGSVLSSFCVVFLLFFPRGKGYFILHVGGVRDSSSAGQSLTYVSILEAYISFKGECNGLAVSKNHYLLL